MSRYGFQHNNKDVIVGWDNPTQTLFADYNNRSTMLDDGNFNIQTVEELEEMFGFNVPSDIKLKLEHDRDTAPAPTLLQTKIGKLFRP